MPQTLNYTQFNLVFFTENDAFIENRDQEIARILRVLANDIENGKGTSRKLFDINGNDVGRSFLSARPYHSNISQYCR